MKNFAKLLLGKKGPPAKRGPFKLTWANLHGVDEPGVGVELSTEHVVFGSEVEPKSEELNLVVPIREHSVAVRVAVEEKPRFVDGGKPWFRVRGKFLGISADDHDLLVRELTGAPEPENRAFAELKSAAGKEDNDYRLLPLTVQRQILDRLVAGKRLDPIVEGQLPAVRMHGLGKFRNAKGEVFRKVNITSRRHLDDQVVSYNTVFVIDSEGNVEVMPD